MNPANDSMELLHVVFAGHVDHGKSTVIGRLLADTGALPRGKLEQVKTMCERNARPFEYAFLIDALKDEQSQGITIDAARCFFRTARRRYLIHDAPGHIEFLKNMITGAARAEAAFIVIDAQEGIRENSKRHGYMISMLGIRQVSVLVNKMDLSGYSRGVFEAIRQEYAKFLGRFGLGAAAFIPVSALRGANVCERSADMPWYEGPTVLGQLDSFVKEQPPSSLPFRLPLQGIYKFTEEGDTRRVFAGTVQTGTVNAGDEIIFHPSGKKAVVKSIEGFGAVEARIAFAGQATGLTIDPQLYVRPGELIARAGEPQPQVSSRFRANIFWMGRAPLIRDRSYKLKIGAARSQVSLVKIVSVLDASDLTTVQNREQVERHDVAECILETPRPVAFDAVSETGQTGRFAIIDNYNIAGAGIVIEPLAEETSLLRSHVAAREVAWKGSAISADERGAAYGHGAKFVVFSGASAEAVESCAQALEKRLFGMNFKAYCLRLCDMISGLDSDLRTERESRDEHIRRLGELARILTDSGQIFITTLPEADDYDIATLELLNKPHEILVLNVGENRFVSRKPDLIIGDREDVSAAVTKACDLLREKKVILDYQI